MKNTPRLAWVLVPALAALAACDNVSDFLSVDPGDLISVSASAERIPADGESTVTITARLPQATLEDDRTVTFYTDYGLWLVERDEGEPEGFIEVLADTGGYASAQLRAAARRGTALVRAEAGGAAGSVGVEFTTAYPQRVLVSSDLGAISVSEFDEATVTARLLRDVGVASEGTLVEWSVESASSRQIGYFSNITASNEDGEAEAIYGVRSDETYRGLVSVVATFRNPDTGAIIRGSTPIEIID